MLNIFDLAQKFDLNLFIKVIMLIAIGLYGIFAFMVSTKIRSFNKILFLPPNSGGGLLQYLASIYVLIIVSLFLLTLVIV